jgi:hypothetical protein
MNTCNKCIMFFKLKVADELKGNNSMIAIAGKSVCIRG